MDRELRVRLYANDRLLKALISVLAVRDPDLLSDLQDIFEIARNGGSELSQNSLDTWIEIQRELKLISDLVGETDEQAPAQASLPLST